MVGLVGWWCPGGVVGLVGLVGPGRPARGQAGKASQAKPGWLGWFGAATYGCAPMCRRADATTFDTHATMPRPEFKKIPRLCETDKQSIRGWGLSANALFSAAAQP